MIIIISCGLARTPQLGKIFDPDWIYLVSLTIMFILWLATAHVTQQGVKITQQHDQLATSS